MQDLPWEMVGPGMRGKCVQCDRDFQKKRVNQLVCSEECRDNRSGRLGAIGISSASVGSISEMAVCCEMLKRGYSVFRTVSPSSFCDVIAVKAAECLFIEVRTGYKGGASQGISFPKALHDKIAIPTHYGIYIPRHHEVHILPISAEDLAKHSHKNRRAS